MDIDDSTPEKIEANDQACAREIQAVLEKWDRYVLSSCVAKPVRDVFGSVVGWCMVPENDIRKKAPKPVAVEARTEPVPTSAE